MEAKAKLAPANVEAANGDIDGDGDTDTDTEACTEVEKAVAEITPEFGCMSVNVCENVSTNATDDERLSQQLSDAETVIDAPHPSPDSSAASASVSESASASASLSAQACVPPSAEALPASSLSPVRKLTVCCDDSPTLDDTLQRRESTGLSTVSEASEPDTIGKWRNSDFGTTYEPLILNANNNAQDSHSADTFNNNQQQQQPLHPTTTSTPPKSEISNKQFQFRNNSQSSSIERRRSSPTSRAAMLANISYVREMSTAPPTISSSSSAGGHSSPLPLQSPKMQMFSPPFASSTAPSPFLLRKLSRDDTLDSTCDSGDICDEEVVSGAALTDSCASDYCSQTNLKPSVNVAKLADEVIAEEVGEEEDALVCARPSESGVDDEDDDDNSDEESSISVSQHGVVVTQQSAINLQSRTKSNAAESIDQTSRLKSSIDNEDDKLDSDASLTPTQSPFKSNLAEPEVLDVVENSPETSAMIFSSTQMPSEQTLPLQQTSSPTTTTIAQHQTHLASKPNLPSTDSTSGPVLAHLVQNHWQPSLETSDEKAGDTNTIKRRKQTTSKDKELADAFAVDSSNCSFNAATANAPTVADDSATATGSSGSQLAPRRRGPPLAQLKGMKNSQQHSEPTEEQIESCEALSICSSCSCQDDATTTTSLPTQLDEDRDGDKDKSRAKLSKASRIIKTEREQTTSSNDDSSVHTQNYWLSRWLYVSAREETEIWRRAIDMAPQKKESVHDANKDQNENENADNDNQDETNVDSVETSSTTSETAFSKRFKATTRKMIHRRATVEMYDRILNNSLKSEKRVEISRNNGEFGFRIHGSRPVVVSAIERGTAAETCGLQVGDLIYAINSTKILDASHNDVVKLAHKGKFLLLLL